MLDHLNSALPESKCTLVRTDSIANYNHKTLGRERFATLAATSGDHIGKVTPVPIPNTVVKLSEPMIVPKARK